MGKYAIVYFGAMMISIHNSLSKKMNNINFTAGKLYSFKNPNALLHFYCQTDPRIDIQTFAVGSYLSDGFYISLQETESVMMLEAFRYKKSNYIKFLTPSGLICFTMIGGNIKNNFKKFFKNAAEP